jgi:D-alanyl-D-alanine carboxypeptidase
LVSRVLIVIAAVFPVLAGVSLAMEPVQPQVGTGTLMERISKGKFSVPLSRLHQQSRIQTAKPRAVPATSLAGPVRGPRSASTSGNHKRGRSAVRIARTNPPPSPNSVVTKGKRKRPGISGFQPIPARVDQLLGGPLVISKKTAKSMRRPRIKAKALFCIDNSSNKVVLARNISEPLPIASISKLLTAMTVLDGMNLKRIVRVPDDIRQVPRHRVGLRRGDLLSVEDLLHGMLIESGNDCAEALARAYPKGGRAGFMRDTNRKALRLGAKSVRLYTPSGLDKLNTLGRKGGRDLVAKQPNVATATDVALIARHAFSYPLIRKISRKKKHIIKTRNKKKRVYHLANNDKLLHRKLPVAGAKTGYTNMAGRCIVALFKDRKSDYTVVVLNTNRHFKAAEKIYHWACKVF